MADFEVKAAYVMGVVLPLLETLRRRTNFSSIASYVDDYLAGAFLLYAAVSVTRNRPRGRALLIAAWGVLAGGMYGSFFGQIENIGKPDISGQSNVVVILVKGALYAVSLIALVAAVRRASNSPNRAH